MDASEIQGQPHLSQPRRPRATVPSLCFLVLFALLLASFMPPFPCATKTNHAADQFLVLAPFLSLNITRLALHA
jgi:hypothetical protein